MTNGKEEKVMKTAAASSIQDRLNQDNDLKGFRSLSLTGRKIGSVAVADPIFAGSAAATATATDAAAVTHSPSSACQTADRE